MALPKFLRVWRFIGIDMDPDYLHGIAEPRIKAEIYLGAAVKTEATDADFLDALRAEVAAAKAV